MEPRPSDEFAFEHLPETIRDRASELVAVAHNLYENERHYEVLQTVDAIMRLCEDASDDVPSHVDRATSSTTDDCAEVASSSPLSTHPAFSTFMNSVNSWPVYVTSKNRTDACNELVHDLDDFSAWSKVMVYPDGTGTHHRSDAAGNQYFKVIGNVDANALYVCCTIMELDLYSEWFPMCSFSQSQGDISRFHRSSFFILDSPWLFANREAFLVGYGIDDLEQHGRILIMARSVDESKEALPEGVRPPPKISGNVRCNVEYGGFRLEVTSPTSTRLSFIMSMDPKIPKIPKAVLNWVCGKVMWRVLGEIQKAAKLAQDCKSKYYARRRERPDVYGLFRERYHAVLKRMLPNDCEQHLLPEEF